MCSHRLHASCWMAVMVTFSCIPLVRQGCPIFPRSRHFLKSDVRSACQGRVAGTEPRAAARSDRGASTASMASQGHLVFQCNPDEGQRLYRLGSQPTASSRNVRMACPPEQANRGVTQRGHDLGNVATAHL